MGTMKTSGFTGDAAPGAKIECVMLKSFIIVSYNIIFCLTAYLQKITVIISIPC